MGLVARLDTPDVLFKFGDAVFFHECFGELCLVKFFVDAFLGEEFLVAAPLCYGSVLYDKDLVRCKDGR